jgi:hypothetical protein
MKRQLIESLERRKDSMIASLWSNSNYDDDKGTRRQAIEELEENFEEAKNFVLFGPEEEIEIAEDNEFFNAAERGLQKIQAPRNDEGTVNEVVQKEEQDYGKFIDQ